MAELAETLIWGKLTCKNASLVDYVIALPCVFPCICDFYVGDFDECLSDIHCPVFVKLNNVTDSHETIQNVNVSQCMMGFAKPVWRLEAERDYLTEIDEGRVEVIGLTRNARRKGPSIEKLKVCIKVMLIIIPKE